MGRIQDKVAVITGAGDGIGHGIARRFAQEGARVLVAEIDDEKGAAVAEELTRDFGTEAEFLHTDATLEADNNAMIARAVERWGTVDILVNNAWGGDKAGLKRVDKMPTDAMFHAINMKLMGPFWAMQAAFPHMKAQGWGRVISLCSLNGVNAHMGSVHYNSSAEGLRTLTRTAAREWAGFGITANSICPGAKTAAFRAFEQMAPDVAAASEAANPMGHLGDPETDIAPVALFLASEDSRYITGNTLYADGGSHINGAVWVPDLDED
ncbi:SDR family NAD(P)-dependent oxidoreductase [Rhabdothermincola salaria]|uniref:SDR family NAD(P)-dependent oxidoreductase n=1 Tax=Rhabdothermincola salaria TaxID=2903142 RepID=UPI001E51A73C|nr:SDR family oxidoreductase [Rhabdothermincola salaria]MCD9624856.1 SDR family oxidoreductase [Rhabdothermincola salaria]